MISRLKALLTDPAKRPQLIIWTGVAMASMILVIAGSVIGTSTNWFCTEPCHAVHYDNTQAFNESSHVMISCAACHEPLNGSPIDLIMLKLEVAPDLIPTILGTFHLPMNENHAVALEMPDEMCTQCHDLSKRTITPSAGIVINHEVHAANHVGCTSCHNRIAHPEDNVTFALEGSKKHEDWMQMDACFRCHSLEAEAMAPGECAACHTADFTLLPVTHNEPNWYQEFGDSAGHAAAYSEEASRVAQAETWASGLVTVEHNIGYEQTVNTCFTCHARQFCTDCHGTEMPHPADFKTNHGQAGLDNPQSCAKCHARTEAEAASQGFCNACHHPQGEPDKAWLPQHFVPVKEGGASQCFDCHNPRYCSACHVSGPDAARRFLQEQRQ